MALAAVSDHEVVSKVLTALRKAAPEQGMMIRQLAEATGVSLTTAGKYVDVCEAAGLVEVTPFATAKLVKLTAAGKSRAGGK